LRNPDSKQKVEEEVYYAPPLIGGDINRCFCLTSVCRVRRAKLENKEAQED